MFESKSLQDILTLFAFLEKKTPKPKSCLQKKQEKNFHHITQASGSGDELTLQYSVKVLDEQNLETTGTDEGTGTIPGVPDVPIYESKSYDNDDDDLLNLENPSPADNEIASLMETSAHHVMVVPENTSGFIHPPPPFFNPLLQQATLIPTPTTSKATTLFPLLPDFSSVFRFNNRVTNLEKDLSEIKQVDQYAQALPSNSAIVDRYMDNKLGEAINKAIQAHNLDCRKEAQDEKNAYIELLDTSMRALIKEEVNTQLP
ncbi:hypothetical protein Tco_0517699 [Tanacetum coccineum]